MRKTRPHHTEVGKWYWAVSNEAYDHIRDELHYDGGTNFGGVSVVQIAYSNGRMVRDASRTANYRIVDKNPPLLFDISDYKYFIGPIEFPRDVLCTLWEIE